MGIPNWALVRPSTAVVARWPIRVAAGHAVDAVVDEEGGEPLAPGGGGDDLGHADGGQVAVPLVGKDHLVGMDPADAGGHGGGPAMGGLAHIHVHILVCHYAAADGGDADGLAQLTVFLQHLHDEPVGDAMGAAGAIVGAHREHTVCIGKDRFHFKPSNIAFAFWVTSREVGMMPPVR